MPSSTEVAERALGHAYGLGTLLASIVARPLYVSAALPSKVFDNTTQLLTNAGEHSMSVASVDERIFFLRPRADAIGSAVTLFAGPFPEVQLYKLQLRHPPVTTPRCGVWVTDTHSELQAFLLERATAS